MEKTFQLKIVNDYSGECHTIQKGDKFNYEKHWWIAEEVDRNPEAGYVTVRCTETDGEVVWPTASEKVVKGTKKSSQKAKKTSKSVQEGSKKAQKSR